MRSNFLLSRIKLFGIAINQFGAPQSTCCSVLPFFIFKGVLESCSLGSIHMSPVGTHTRAHVPPPTSTPTGHWSSPAREVIKSSIFTKIFVCMCVCMNLCQENDYTCILFFKTHTQILKQCINYEITQCLNNRSCIMFVSPFLQLSFLKKVPGATGESCAGEGRWWVGGPKEQRRAWLWVSLPSTLHKLQG